MNVRGLQMQTATQPQATRRDLSTPGANTAGWPGSRYRLVLAPKDGGEFTGPWDFHADSVPGAFDRRLGFANTVAMAEAGLILGRWARSLTIDGHTDWYVPSADELSCLYLRLHRGNMLINGARCLDTRAWYWSSTQCAHDTRYASGFDFGSGQRVQIPKWQCRNRARAVRRVRVD